METYVASLARTGRRGIIIDSNLLVIYLVGLYGKEYVEKFLTSKTLLGDFEIIKWLMQKYKFEKCIVTPQIMAEVSNLTFDHFTEPGLTTYIQRALTFIKNAHEEHTHKDELLSKYHLPKLGFADSSIIEVAKKGNYLVLTEDVKLAAMLSKEGCVALNINHLRMLAI